MRKQNKKNIYLLGSSSMFNDMGSEMISPILPFFISSLGGGGVTMGLISGLREGLSSLLKLFGGWFSDKIGKRKEIVFIGYMLSIILKFFIGFAQTTTQIITAVSLERVGKIRDPPRDAIIARMKGKHANTFGLHQTFDSLGGALGTIIVILIFWLLHWNFRTIVFAAAFITMFSLIPLFFVKDVKSYPLKATLLQGVSKLDRKLKRAIYLIALFAFANFGLYMFILVTAKNISGNEIIPLVLYAIFNLVYALSANPIGKVADKFGKRLTLICGYLLFALVCLGFAYFNSLIAITILFILYGFVSAMTEPVQKAVVADLAGKEKGTAMGYFYFIRGLSAIFGGLIAGFIWDLNNSAMFIYLAVLGIISMTSLYVVRKAEKKIENQKKRK
ncbi:MAG: MFS transporter [archaeon]